MRDGTVKKIVPQNDYFGYGLSRSGTGPVLSRTQGAAGLNGDSSQIKMEDPHSKNVLTIKRVKC